MNTSPTRKAKIRRVKVCGPKKVSKSRRATYRVRILVKGNTPATGVRLKVRGKGIRSNKRVGKIGAGKTRKVKVAFRPKRLGKIRVKFQVASSNADGKTLKRWIRIKRW
ncbi:MAG: hypothetical protein IPK93_04670 [Solirubrobacterales bacterium]|nr:hypothetical protein [Solirubrobacterales bacterium]